MHILILSTSSRNGGAAIAASRLANDLSPYIQVTLLTQDSILESVANPIRRKLLAKWFRLRRIVTRLLLLIDNRKDCYCSYNMLPSSMVTAINRLEPDLVHLHWVGGELLSIEDISKIKSPLVWTLHDLWPIIPSAEHHLIKTSTDTSFLASYRPLSLTSILMMRRKLRLLQQRSPHFIAPSHWASSLFQNSFAAAYSKVAVIPNSIDLSIFKVNRELVHLHANESLKEIRILVGSLASITDKVKGFDILLEVLHLLKLWNYKFELLTIGRSLEQITSDFSVTHLGQITSPQDMAMTYNSVHLTCIASRIETHSQTACESIACGTPVAAFDVAGNPSIVEHGKSGYLAQPFSPSDLANGIISCSKLGNSIEKRMLISKTALRWSSNVVVKSHLALYKQFLDGDTFNESP